MAAPEAYSALVGLPIVGVPPGVTVFTVESTYVEAACGPGTTTIAEAASSSLQQQSSSLPSLGLTLSCADCVTDTLNHQTACDTTRYVERVAAFLGPPVVADEAQLEQKDCPGRNTSAWLRNPRSISLASASPSASDRMKTVVFTASCPIMQVAVRARVRCASGNCAVTAIRGAMRTGRIRAAVIIQSAASSALSPGSPSYARVGAIIGVSTSG